MGNLIILSIFIIKLTAITSSFLPAALNFVKPQLERNNILNKGVWVKSKGRNAIEGVNTGDFIFSTNSLDEDVLQNDFDAFRDNYDAPVVSNYIERAKRSSSDERKRVIKDSIKACNGDHSCIKKKLDDKTLIVKSKLITKLKPASVFNDYPYEVAVLLSGYNPKDNRVRNIKESKEAYKTVMPLHDVQENKQVLETLNTVAKVENVIKYNDSDNGIPTPRRTKSDYESQIIKKIEFTEEIDNTVGNSTTNKVDRNVFDKEERLWYQNTPNTDSNFNNEGRKNKPINERGLIKVLSMLTKTFKKIMRQHNDIKAIHYKLRSLYNDVTKNIADVTVKFEDFEKKYAKVIEVSDKITEFEAKINAKEDSLETKDREMSKNLLEFENQQKKFLTQQRQFYNIQKLMLEQNEKINIKQNLIAKTQSEISHRQNNFARILKKAKQIYVDNKQSTLKKLSTTTLPTQTTEDVAKITHTTTETPYTTESVKINLFSIPAFNELVNQDSLILKEKDKQPVDDLVYKYYFNNTFIDNLMKSKVLASFINTPQGTELSRKAKNKRNEQLLETTILLPVKNDTEMVREKRWIRRSQTKSKLKRKSRGNDKIRENEEKNTNKEEAALQTNDKTRLVAVKNKKDPFVIMANNFCNEIGQNTDSQVLDWCVEKALRKLQNIDLNINSAATPAKANTKMPTTKMNPIIIANNIMSSKDIQAVSDIILFSPSSSISPMTTIENDVEASTMTANVYFPDNEELELNLKQFELKPDKEGNIYYDGSVHTSDIVLESGGFSDIMAGLDSNSRVEVDPLILNLQALRRDPLHKLDELKRMTYG